MSAFLRIRRSFNIMRRKLLSASPAGLGSCEQRFALPVCVTGSFRDHRRKGHCALLAFDGTGNLWQHRKVYVEVEIPAKLPAVAAL